MRRFHVLLLAIAALSLTQAPAWAGGRGRQPSAPVQLSAVTVGLDGPFVRITVRGTSALPTVTPVATTEGPPRVFIDLPGVSPGQVPASVTGRAIVRRVRVALNSADPPVTRLVLDLAGPVTTGVVPAGAEVTIAVAPAEGVTATAPPPVAAATTPAPPPMRPAPVAVPSPLARPPQAAASTARPTPPPVSVPAATSPRAVRPQPPPAALTAAARPAAVPPSPLPAPKPAAVAPPTASSPSPTVVAAAVASTTTTSSTSAPAAAPAASSPSTGATQAMTVQTAPAAPRPLSGFGMGRGAHPTGRVAIYTSGSRATQAGGFSTGYGDIMTAVSYSFTDRDTDGVEYGLDVRHTAYSIEGRDPRVSLYTGYVGARLAGGHANLRAGHLWLDDLGGLGALAGAQVEARSGPIPTEGLGRWRAGFFGGLDPNVYRFGYSEGVRKLGGYAVLEGAHGRRHVAGYINVHNGAMTERSVLSFANFVPAGPLFVYQVAEYDLSPVAGGLGHDGLSYFFSNARVNVGKRVELQGLVSRGRSVDARGLSDDIQAGRPVTQQAIDGLRYESVGGRVTAEVLPRVRLYGGYSRDKNNRDDAPTGRWLVGGFAGNVGGSGLDLTFSDSRMMRPTGTYHSTYASAGRELGRRVYATAEFSTALSQVRFVRGDGFVVETNPSTKRFGGNTSVQMWRGTSLFVSVERTLDGDYREWRAMTGLTFRLR